MSHVKHQDWPTCGCDDILLLFEEFCILFVMQQGVVGHVVGPEEGGVEAGKIQDTDRLLVQADSVALYWVHEMGRLLQLHCLLQCDNGRLVRLV